MGIGKSATLCFRRAAYSCALGLAALAAPAIGRAIDRRDSVPVLALSNLVFAGGLVGLSLCTGTAGLFATWLVIGLGVALGLYEAAFAVLVRQHGHGARNAIIGITLLGGFASTVGWPLTSAWVSQHDWRTACQVWAALHLLVALPLNLFASRGPVSCQPVRPAVPGGTDEVTAAGRGKLGWLALFSAGTAFVTSAMAAHLPALLFATGVGTAVAIAASSCVGASQVAGRLLELFLARQLPQPPLRMAKIAVSLHPLGAAGYGVLTMAHRIAQAVAPFAFALVLDTYGVQVALIASAAISAFAWLALAALPR